jgi:maltose/moltooligosaccharide transporter
MNFGFFGIQYSFGLQQTAINPLYSFLHAKPEQLPILNLAGPMTGLIIQPLIGALSDKTWSPKWGRRKPFFLTGAVGCSICLFFFPFCSALWMAVGLLWLLDASNNTAMEPYRAFIADKLPTEQRALGFLTQSFFTGLGITLANISLFVFQKLIKGETLTSTGESGIPYWVYGSFFVGAVCSIGSVLWSVSKTPEIPPTDKELEEIKRKNAGLPPPVIQFFLSFLTTIIAYIVLLILFIPNLFFRGLIKRVIAATERNPVAHVLFSQNIEIVDAIFNMPRTLWELALVYLFQWYAMFCYWQFISLSIAKSVWHTTAEANKELYEQAVGWTGLVNGFYNVVTFCSAFGLVWMVNKFSAKKVHVFCLMLAAISLFILPHIENKYFLFAPMIGFGIAWASMMGVPYIMVVGSIPKERYGVYMGIVNMMIVIPMIMQTLSFGYVYKKFLGGNPSNAITFAGAYLLIASLATMLIKVVKPVDEIEIPLSGGH